MPPRAKWLSNNFGEISWLAQASTDSKQKGLFAVNLCGNKTSSN
jgi:hypothetical protein